MASSIMTSQRTAGVELWTKFVKVRVEAVPDVGKVKAGDFVVVTVEIAGNRATRIRTADRVRYRIAQTADLTKA